MMMKQTNIKAYSDKSLMTHFALMVKKERGAIADVILHLSEIGKRRLYLKEAYASLFSYLVEKHHYCRSAAYRRIQAAKLSLRFSEVITYLRSGALNLTSVSLLEPYMKSDKHRLLLRECMGKSKQAVEDLLTERYGKEIKTFDKIRRLPVQRVSVKTMNYGDKNKRGQGRIES